VSGAVSNSVVSRRSFLAPLALAQFICSFAGSNMNVMINDITDDLDTTMTGMQATITLFLLIMAILVGLVRIITGVLIFQRSTWGLCSASPSPASAPC
jgi:hypothetical protein